jgi:predicted MFS family arabinose efflux permease
VVERASRLAGAPLAGILIAAIGPTQVLWADAATFIVSAAIIGLGVSRPRRPAPVERGGYVAALREGFAFLRRDRTLSSLIGVVTLTNLLDAISMVVLPVMAQRIYGSAVSLGLMLGAVGGGSILGALAFAAAGGRVSRRAVVCAGFLGITVWYPVAAAFPRVGWLIAAQALAGVCSGPLNPVIQTVLYERVPDGIRGRVLGVVQAAAWLAMPLGVLIAGPLVEWAGLRATLLASGAAYAAIALSTTLLPLGGLERQPPNRGESGSARTILL